MIKSVAVAFGTRPEVIKMAPLIKEFQRRGIDPIKISTGQHFSMLWQALDFFGLDVDHDLGVMHEGQTLTTLLSRIMLEVEPILKRERPEVIIVQGDTATALGSGLAAYFNELKVAHLEAGLRTYDHRHPFPEEGNRSLLSKISSWHFCPTEGARSNLLREGINPECTFVTGNTVVDALYWGKNKLKAGLDLNDTAKMRSLAALVSIPREALDEFVLITSHRRENFGRGLADICSALCELVSNRPDLYMIWPVHLNPMIRREVEKLLGGCGTRLIRIEPVDYEAMLFLLEHCRFILTDSGGIQEEAAVFGKPVLIMREVTERPEILDSGGGKLVGTDPKRILAAVNELLDDKDVFEQMANVPNPFGDGHAAERVVDVLLR